MNPLTETQAQTVDFVAWRSVNDVPPSMRDLSEEMGWSSTNAAACMVEQAIRKGWLVRHSIGRSRGLSVAWPTRWAGGIGTCMEHLLQDQGDRWRITGPRFDAEGPKPKGTNLRELLPRLLGTALYVGAPPLDRWRVNAIIGTMPTDIALAPVTAA